MKKRNSRKSLGSDSFRKKDNLGGGWGTIQIIRLGEEVANFETFCLLYVCNPVGVV